MYVHVELGIKDFSVHTQSVHLISELGQILFKKPNLVIFMVEIC